MLDAIKILFVDNGAINPWFSFFIGASIGISATITYFKCFYTPKLDGAVKHNAASTAALYHIMESMDDLKDNANEKNRNERLRIIKISGFQIRMIAEMHSVIPFAFVRKRILKHIRKAEEAALDADLNALEKAFRKIKKHVA